MSESTPPKSAAKADSKAAPAVVRYKDLTKEFGSEHVVQVLGIPTHLFPVNHQKGDPLDVLPLLSNPPAGDPRHVAHPIGFCLHWQATGYTSSYDDYHVVILWDAAKKQPVLVKNLAFTAKGSHLWGRNSGMIGVSFAACDDASRGWSGHPANFGRHPVQPEMIEMAAQFIAEYMAYRQLPGPGHVYDLPKKASNNSTIWTVPGVLKTPIVSDHAFFARNDGYGADRWDVDAYLPLVVKRVDEIYRELKGVKKPDGSTRHFEFDAIL